MQAQPKQYTRSENHQFKGTRNARA